MRVLVLVLALAATSCGYVEHAYQRDMDRMRMQDIHAIADVILLYKERNDRFPFQVEATNRPIEVFISERNLPKWLEQQKIVTGFGYKTHQELEEKLRTVAGAQYVLPSEPQKVETFAPNVYQYHVESGYMCVSANLYFANKDTRSVRGQYHKYQICAKNEYSADET